MAMTPEQRLVHDVRNGIRRSVFSLLRYTGSDEATKDARVLTFREEMIANDIINELRVRWTLIERPRTQRTLRQES